MDRVEQDASPFQQHHSVKRGNYPSEAIPDLHQLGKMSELHNYMIWFGGWKNHLRYMREKGPTRLSGPSLTTANLERAFRSQQMDWAKLRRAKREFMRSACRINESVNWNKYPLLIAAIDLGDVEKVCDLHLEWIAAVMAAGGPPPGRLTGRDEESSTRDQLSGNSLRLFDMLHKSLGLFVYFDDLVDEGCFTTDEIQDVSIKKALVRLCKCLEDLEAPYWLDYSTSDRRAKLNAR